MPVFTDPVIRTAGTLWKMTQPLVLTLPYVDSSAIAGGEELAYDVQNLKRAMLVGETTGGGANPGGFAKVTEHFTLFVPTGRAISAVTKTSWEGIGVKPDVAVPAAKALDVAYLDALRAQRKRITARDSPQLSREIDDALATLTRAASAPGNASALARALVMARPADRHRTGTPTSPTTAGWTSRDRTPVRETARPACRRTRPPSRRGRQLRDVERGHRASSWTFPVCIRAQSSTTVRARKSSWLCLSNIARARRSRCVAHAFHQADAICPDASGSAQ